MRLQVFTIVAVLFVLFVQCAAWTQQQPLRLPVASLKGSIKDGNDPFEGPADGGTIDSGGIERYSPQEKDIMKQLNEYTENKAVTKGLTHIKYNIYAPSPEEAAKMTPEEFRYNILTKMKRAEEARKRKGAVGGQVSDEYIDSLNRANIVKGKLVYNVNAEDESSSNNESSSKK